MITDASLDVFRVSSVQTPHGIGLANVSGDIGLNYEFISAQVMNFFLGNCCSITEFSITDQVINHNEYLLLNY